MRKANGMYKQVEIITPHQVGHNAKGKLTFLMEDTILGKLSAHLHSVASQIMLAIMTIVITMEVVGRYALGSGLRWSQEVCGLAFFLFVFCTQSNTFQRDRHIRMDIFYDHFSPFFKKVTNILTVICGLIFYSAIVYQGISDLNYQFAIGEGTAELEWPLWPFSAVMVFSSFLVVVLLIQFALKGKGR